VKERRVGILMNGSPGEWELISIWSVRSWRYGSRRDDLLTIQVDGSNGTAVAGLRECYIQPAASTPRPVWNPDMPSSIDYREGWQRVHGNTEYENAFKTQWELFLRRSSF